MKIEKLSDGIMCMESTTMNDQSYSTRLTSIKIDSVNYRAIQVNSHEEVKQMKHKASQSQLLGLSRCDFKTYWIVFIECNESNDFMWRRIGEFFVIGFTTRKKITLMITSVIARREKL